MIANDELTAWTNIMSSIVKLAGCLFLGHIFLMAGLNKKES